MATTRMGCFRLLLLVSSIVMPLVKVAIAAEYSYHECNNILGNLTSNGINNRKTLLSRFFYTRDENHNGFYNSYEGEDTDGVYGMVLCRGDVTPATCSSCINESSQELTRTFCPNQKQAIAWYDECMLRYSNNSITFSWDFAPVYMWSTQNVSNVSQFDQALEELLAKLQTTAASGSSLLKFASGEVNVSSNQTIYALVQCTPDLSQPDCDTCLMEAKYRLSDYNYGKQGGRILGASCNLRYETYPFYNSTAATPPPSTTPVNLSPLPPPTKATSSKAVQQRRIKVGTSVSAILVVGLFCYWIFYRWRRNKSPPSGTDLILGGGRLPNHYSNDNLRGENNVESQEFPLIRLDIINTATNHFGDENKLGEGGFGPVYKGVLAEGREIAVKRLSKTSGQGFQEFKNEVSLIAKLQHKNLVRLVGCCPEGQELLLAYEYMPNKSLDLFLFDPKKSGVLDWKRRLIIINGVARGVLYLHEDSRLKIIHRDLKASNVLLDSDMIPKISDFGMARIFGGNQSEANTNRVVGTYGYMAPEYAMEGIFSIKSDVFSYGVLLLEIICGKKSSRFYHLEHGQTLLTFAWKLWSNGEGLKLVDPVLTESCVLEEALKCIHIGLLCVQEDPADRPTMSSVVVMLVSDSITLPQPTQPAFSVSRVVVRSAESSENKKTSSVNEVTLSCLTPR